MSEEKNPERFSLNVESLVICLWYHTVALVDLYKDRNQERRKQLTSCTNNIGNECRLDVWLMSAPQVQISSV